jgi:uracil phosphoribosyltransferase
MSKQVHVIDHPLIQHKLTLMRKKDTSTAKFRTLLREISVLLGYEITRDMALKTVEIETPLGMTQAKVLDSKKLAFVSILRAGNGILDGMLEILPTARVGHIGLYRDPETLVPIEYYFKLPEDIHERRAVVLDPMLATGHSAAAAVSRIKQIGPTSIAFVCLLASPPGIATFHEHHPDVPIFVAAIDPILNEHGYIIPGLGDAGDRLFGTQ